VVNNVIIEEVQETGIGIMNLMQHLMSYVMQKPLYLIIAVLLIVVQKNDINFKFGKNFGIKL